MPLTGNRRFKFETENSSVERTFTLDHAKHVAMAASEWQGCECCVYVENPKWIFGSPEYWVRIGYADNGVYYSD